jgi:hypothetical protein
MTTGDEPMLPRPTDDNAPMISGRGTKVIADARGAYLAGNLRALVEQMDVPQLMAMRLALIGHAEWLTGITDGQWNGVRFATNYLGEVDIVQHPSILSNLSGHLLTMTYIGPDESLAKTQSALAKQWQLDVAWALLLGKMPPSFPELPT